MLLGCDIASYAKRESQGRGLSEANALRDGLDALASLRERRLLGETVSGRAFVQPHQGIGCPGLHGSETGGLVHPAIATRLHPFDQTRSH